MDIDTLIAQTEQVISSTGADNRYGKYAQAREILRVYGGSRNSFLATLEKVDLDDAFTAPSEVVSILTSFIDYLKSGLHEGISPERRAQLDVVSDYLEMATILLETQGVHPAAPAMLIGATLEEFLRTWVEAESIPLGTRKPGIENYSQLLRDADLITKQDAKDITAWAGIRNHAAHGEWHEVEDKNRIMLMVEGVNLFLRQHSAAK